jgi:hypothetical protein
LRGDRADEPQSEEPKGFEAPPAPAKGPEKGLLEKGSRPAGADALKDDDVDVDRFDASCEEDAGKY